MLSERFLGRLHNEFPSFYDRVNAEAMEEAARIQKETGGDLERALVRARLSGAASVWWPYVKGAFPLVGRDRDAMRAFSRIVLTVSHVVGHPPATMDAARDHVLGVLRQSLDVERLKRIVGGEAEPAKEAAAGAAAGAGLVASMTAVMAPLNAFRSVKKWGRFMPVPVRVTVAAVIVAALLSVPLVAGYSAGIHAEKAAGR